MVVFRSPSWVPGLPFEIPDSIPISDFVLDPRYGRLNEQMSHPAFTCGVTGETYTVNETRKRVEYLAMGLSKTLGWHPNTGCQVDKVAVIYASNSVDYIPLTWAIHRLSGIVSTASAAATAEELAYQLRDSGASVLFASCGLLQTAITAAETVGIPQNRVFLVENDLDQVSAGLKMTQNKFLTTKCLMGVGATMDQMDDLNWKKGEAREKIAFLCYSSGTSGLPKGVMISHYNVMANVLQLAVFERTQRTGETEVCLGLLPQSHVYGLIVICHAAVYRGDGVVVLPKYDFKQLLASIECYSISVLFLVPTILTQIAKSPSEVAKYNLSSVTTIMVGAAPSGREILETLSTVFPGSVIRQGYGLTEAATVVSSTPRHDVWLGSSGSLLPGIECKIIDDDGKEVGYDQSGELLVRSPSVALGYWNNARATAETFQGGWLRTGDVALFRRSPPGHDHVFIIDRLKELIKVKGMQVAPSELEALLLSHPAVAEVAVIPLPDERSGEVPRAVVVKSSTSDVSNMDNHQLADELQQLVSKEKSRYKWLTGGVVFVTSLPKNSTGKLLRRVLRDRYRVKMATKL
ncbi:hypothetical protein Z517_00844 [Fonsecaea pedrosoi CBS 271.37]|uniref:AMP-dependent synthetase/ligase domain-containing protein n=1 Tax=Fonsecaea pedrosoi CBS 271.37 TaxID=1442368 RepID=A0A0D2HLW4_9EURO|nr:uncharacterized protein Z517_00844 [Fonsecaea pedrosoi CBS 271.37]KIW85454.1 hypothetical protein Z517_00844 [Fonsecaea pedrosoi CBS 271.37]